jgi:16S rRNA G966 N2-methylase RsmD
MIYSYNINNFINKRYSIRNLTDAEFEIACIELANQLEIYDYKFKYTDDQLKKDWKNLLSEPVDKNCINSTVRHGMKICEHFMDNFWEIKDSKGRSFINQWNSDNLIKVLKWNRKSHSTPYISEIRRGIYFCTGMTKSTMFRPFLSKLIVDKYAKNSIVLDPCAGWGGRMIGTIAAGAYYVGFEPNTKTYNNLLRIIDYLNLKGKVTLYNDVAENIDKYDFPEVRLVLTSPPYYNLEVYSDESTQSVKTDQSYNEWLFSFLTPVIHKCINRGNNSVCSAWNVANFSKYKLIQDVEKIHNVLGFSKVDEFVVTSSKRQSNQISTKNAKSNDYTICYKKT